MINEIFFDAFSLVLLGSAAMVVTARNPVHSVLFLILAFFNAAGLFLMAGAEFLALILLIVYVGAVAVLFLFVVMMLDVDFDQFREGYQRYAPVGAAVGLVLFAELAMVFLHWHLTPAGDMRAAPIPANMQNTLALGRLIYTDYVFLFQASALVLLVAMIGAIVLTHRERKSSTRRQNISEQVNRMVADTMVVVPVPVGAAMKDVGVFRKLPKQDQKAHGHGAVAHGGAHGDAHHVVTHDADHAGSGEH